MRKIIRPIKGTPSIEEDFAEFFRAHELKEGFKDGRPLPPEPMDNPMSWRELIAELVSHTTIYNNRHPLEQPVLLTLQGDEYIMDRNDKLDKIYDEKRRPKGDWPLMQIYKITDPV